jgi:SAM-dependent methyltransferase
MPFSTNYFKEQTQNYINSKFNKNINILDVGAGAGTYANLLKQIGFSNIDCVEVFDNYIKDYSLSSKYKNVIVGDVTELDIDFSQYDLIIFGDVLEHIEKSKAIKLLSKIKNIPCIICVPFKSIQGEHFGNPYEKHLQSDLTLELFCESFEEFHPFCLRFDYGVFINEIPTELFFEVGQNQLPNNYLKFVVKNYPSSEYVYINAQPKTKNMIKISDSKVTLVTGLWDIKRDSLGDGWNRSYNHYLDKFKQLLDVENNLIIFGDAKLKEFVFKHRNESNTLFFERSLDWFKNNDYFNIIQKIRLNPNWYKQVGWLEESTQAKLEYYNPLVMSKMFLLHDAKIMDPFDSEYMFWIDAGLTNTVHPGYFTHDKVLNNLPKYISKFSFVCFPYETTTEIHGFEIKKMNEIAGDNVNKVARGGFFGGPKNAISDINSIYYNILMSTLQDGYMGTEESLFSIMAYKHSDLINYFEIEGNGLFGKFFEDLKNNTLEIKSENIMINNEPLDTSKVGLYVIGFNSPNQFETLIKSMLDYDANFIHNTSKFLLDNSTDLTTTPRYIELCEEYGFEHIKKDNLGICGGRQFIAEHFDASDLDVMIFSEDDMNFYNKPNEVCRNGFNRYTPNLYNKCLNIIKKEKYDFLKINFSEFYGDNSTQWSWYNVPQDFRIKNWPEKPNLPVHGLDANAPRTKFNNIKSIDGLPYADGEIYYCNWTHFVTKAGNKKMFIDTKFAHPFENTWMSFMYQETIKGVIKPGILLLTPVEHHRFDHYAGELRREN